MRRENNLLQSISKSAEYPKKSVKIASIATNHSA